jgi:hypothetical protein
MNDFVTSALGELYRIAKRPASLLMAIAATYVAVWINPSFGTSVRQLANDSDGTLREILNGVAGLGAAYGAIGVVLFAFCLGASSLRDALGERFELGDWWIAGRYKSLDAILTGFFWMWFAIAALNLFGFDAEVENLLTPTRDSAVWELVFVVLPSWLVGIYSVVGLPAIWLRSSLMDSSARIKVINEELRVKLVPSESTRPRAS